MEEKRKAGGRENVLEQRWMDKNRSADRNERLEVKRQRGNGDGVVDSEMLQSSFHPSLLSPASALDGTAQSRGAHQV